MSNHVYQKDIETCRNITAALISEGFSANHSIENDETTVTVIFFDDLTQDQSDSLDTFMAAYDGELWTTRDARKRSIDIRTAELIECGFTYDGDEFSLSVHAQMNWNRMAINHANGLINFPTNKVSTKNGKRHTFSDASDFEAFEATYTAALEDIVEGGRTLKDQLDTATSVAELDAVVDNR